VTIALVGWLARQRWPSDREFSEASALVVDLAAAVGGAANANGPIFSYGGAAYDRVAADGQLLNGLMTVPQGG
jgi:hypothetical protein